MVRALEGSPHEVAPGSGTPAGKLRFHDHDNLATTMRDAAVDIQFEFPFGFKELEGIHSRTDFDLGAHQELSGKTAVLRP